MHLMANLADALREIQSGEVTHLHVEVVQCAPRMLDTADTVREAVFHQMIIPAHRHRKM